MSLRPVLPNQVIAASSWTIKCPDCAQDMTMTATGLSAPKRETRAYACVCGHRERITVTIRRRNANPGQ